MTQVFICYRREDTAAKAQLVGVALRDKDHSVFIDESSLGGGAQWPTEIEKAVRACRVFIALIGPQWLSVRDDHGRRRIDSEGDWVRRELELALRKRKRVIPVLIGDAARPSLEALPRSLAFLAELQVVRLSDEPSAQELEKLRKTVEQQPRIVVTRGEVAAYGAAAIGVIVIAYLGVTLYRAKRQLAEFRCEVSIETEIPGAFVKWHPAAGNDAQIVGPTPATVIMRMGRYTIWSVRNGSPTSARLTHDVLDEKMRIVIPER